MSEAQFIARLQTKILNYMVERIKHRLRQNRFLAPLMGCPYPALRWNRAVKRVIRELGPDARILDLGSGTHRRAPNVINLEIEATPMVDVVADGHCLPFADNVFDAVISEAVLEHVREPQHVVAEMFRVLKPGGYVCAAVPFLQGYHASPHDYQRWTATGFVALFSQFREIESGACAGPTAALHWIFREYVGLICSFGSLLVAKAVSLFVGWLTFVAEMFRVLKPGGYVCAAVPFLQGYHASPHDYQRWTATGFVALFSQFREIESGACAGPTAALHWIFREYVGLICSFGSLLVAKAVSLFVGWLTFPLVLLDMLLMLHPHSHILASAVYFVGRKET